MAEQSEVALSFARGEDHVSHEARIPEGYARRVVNWDLDDSGVAHQSRAFGLNAPAGDTHSLWLDPDTRDVFGVAAGVLCRIQGGIFVPVQWATGGDVLLPDEARVYYLKLNGEVYFSDALRHGVIAVNGFARTWGVPNPVPGNRDEGAALVRYLTYEDQWGRESGAVRFDTGVAPYLSDRVARLYWSDESTTQYRLNGTGRELRTQGRVQFPPGRFIESLGGRVLTARGSKVYYSDPLNTGLIDPRYHFASVEGRITAMATVVDGLYVATASEVVFFRGVDPGEWRVERVAGRGVLPGGVCRVPLTALADEVTQQERGGEKYVVAMLTEDGPLFGLSSGRIFAPNKGRIRLPRGAEVRMDVVQRNGYYQLVAFPQEVDAAAMEAADLPIEHTGV